MPVVIFMHLLYAVPGCMAGWSGSLCRQDGIKIGAHNTITLYGGVFAQENVPEIRCNMVTGRNTEADSRNAFIQLAVVLCTLTRLFKEMSVGGGEAENWHNRHFVYSPIPFTRTTHLRRRGSSKRDNTSGEPRNRSHLVSKDKHWGSMEGQMCNSSIC